MAITAALDEVAREEGFLMCPEGAATYAAYKQGLADGRVNRTRPRVVLFNCATGLKYPLPPIERTLDRAQADRFRRRCEQMIFASIRKKTSRMRGFIETADH